MPQIRFSNSDSLTKIDDPRTASQVTSSDRNQSTVIDVPTPKGLSNTAECAIPSEGTRRYIAEPDSALRREKFSGSTLDMPDVNIPLQFQDDFNWDNISEEGDDSDSGSSGEAQGPPSRFMRLHPLLRTFVVMITGGLILILPTAIIIATHKGLPFRHKIPRATPNYQHLYSLQCAARSFALLTSVWVFGVLIYHLVDMIPDITLRAIRLFTGRHRIEKAKDQMQFFIAIKLYVKMVSISSVSLISFVIMFPRASYRLDGKVGGSDSTWDQVLFQLNVLILLAVGILGLEKLVLKLIATRFHRTAYRDRIDAQTYASWVLDRLNRSRDSPTSTDDATGETANLDEPLRPDAAAVQRRQGASYAGARKSGDEAAVPPPVRRAATIESNGSSSRRSLSSAPTSLGGQRRGRGIMGRLWSIKDRAFDGGSSGDMNSSRYATRLARKLFNSLTNERDYLIVDDFLPFFDKEEDAIKAFEFFDKDSNGDISKREMRDRILLIYKERRTIIAALSDMSQVVGQLDLLMMCFVLVVVVIVALLVFGLDALKSLATIGTMFVGWSFIFGNTFKNVFECIVFLFQIHPFDVDDVVVIAAEFLVVHKIRLLSTVFYKSDGTYTVYQNSQLAAMKVQNMRRSHSQFESIAVGFDLYAPSEKLHELRRRMDAYVEENPRDMVGSVSFNIDLLENSNRILINVGFTHKSNWQNPTKRWRVRNGFGFALKQAITDLNLRYKMPLQPVSMVSPPPNHDASMRADSMSASSSSGTSLSLRGADADDLDDSLRARGNLARRSDGNSSSADGGPAGSGGSDPSVSAAVAAMMLASEM